MWFLLLQVRTSVCAFGSNVCQFTAYVQYFTILCLSSSVSTRQLYQALKITLFHPCCRTKTERCITSGAISAVRLANARETELLCCANFTAEVASCVLAKVNCGQRKWASLQVSSLCSLLQRPVSCFVRRSQCSRPIFTPAQ